jgi:hypothetical protein
MGDKNITLTCMALMIIPGDLMLKQTTCNMMIGRLTQSHAIKMSTAVTSSYFCISLCKTEIFATPNWQLFTVYSCSSKFATDVAPTLLKMNSESCKKKSHF